MAFDNISLWFAKDENGKIITINEVINEDSKIYFCPICGSKVRPRALESKDVSPHFYHLEETCNTESMIHWWVKNKLIEKGDKFTIRLESSNQEFICKEVFIEKTYKTNDENYKPDLTVITENEKTIFFEMKYSNKKNPENYINKWMDLKNIVVEIDIKELIRLNKEQLPTFKALFDGERCLTKENNKDFYYNNLGKYREGLIKNNSEENKDRIKKLDWFWKDITSYKNDQKDISDVAIAINNIKDKEDREIIVNILKKPKCNDILLDYLDYKKENLEKQLKEYEDKFKELDMVFNYEFYQLSKIYDRVYNIGISINIDKNKIYYEDCIENSEDEKLIKRISNIYNHQLKYLTIKKEIDKINNLYKYDGVCQRIKVKKNPNIKLYENWGSYYCFNSKPKIYAEANYDYTYSDCDFKDLNIEISSEEVAQYINNYLENNNTSNPYDLKSIINLDFITGNIIDKFSFKNEYYEWNVDCILDCMEYEIVLKLNAHNKNIACCTISLENNTLLINNKTHKEDFCINDGLENLEQMITKVFNETVKNNIPISNNIINAIELLKEKYNALNVKFDFVIHSPTQIKLTFKYQDDIFSFNIINNELYRKDLKMVSFENKDTGYIVDIFTKILNQYLFIDFIEYKKDIYKEMILNLNYKYSCTLFDKWRINKKNNILVILDKDSEIVDEFILLNDCNNLKDLEKRIINQFGDSIRKYKYGTV